MNITFVTLPAAINGLLVTNSSPSVGNYRRMYLDISKRNPEFSSIEVLNKLWRQQLAVLPINTVFERECLCPSQEPLIWFNRFVKYILPIIVDFNLPVGENHEW